MRTYWTFFRMRVINGLQYRTAAWAGVFTQFFWGFMEIQLYRVLYAANPDRFPMELPAIVSYIWLRQSLLALLNTWTIENELFNTVLDGSVAYELCRPSSLYGMWYTRTLALRVSRVLLRCLPILLVAALLPRPWGMNAPASAGAFIAFMISLMLAACVTVAYTMILYFSCFYTTSADGLRAVLMPLSDLMSGGYLPLPFLPAGIRIALELSPFGSMQNAPLRIYSGDIAGAAAVSTIALQLFWLAALGAIGYLMQNKGMKKLSIAGG